MYLTKTEYTRRDLRKPNGYIEREAKRLLTAYPHTKSVCMAEYGGSSKVVDLHAQAGPTTIIYVRSRRGGQYGRSRAILVPAAPKPKRDGTCRRYTVEPIQMACEPGTTSYKVKTSDGLDAIVTRDDTTGVYCARGHWGSCVSNRALRRGYIRAARLAAPGIDARNGQRLKVVIDAALSKAREAAENAYPISEEQKNAWDRVRSKASSLSRLEDRARTLEDRCTKARWYSAEYVEEASKELIQIQAKVACEKTKAEEDNARAQQMRAFEASAAREAAGVVARLITFERLRAEPPFKVDADVLEAVIADFVRPLAEAKRECATRHPDIQAALDAYDAGDADKCLQMLTDAGNPTKGEQLTFSLSSFPD